MGRFWGLGRSLGVGGKCLFLFFTLVTLWSLVVGALEWVLLVWVYGLLTIIVQL